MCTIETKPKPKFDIQKDGNTFVVKADGIEIFASKNQLEAKRYLEQTLKDFELEE
jgi:hypothetical protein